MVPHAVPSVGIGLPVTHNDDVDAISTVSSLATSAPGEFHLTIVGGTIVVELTVTRSALDALRREWVSCNVIVRLAVRRGHVRGLYRGGPIVV